MVAILGSPSTRTERTETPSLPHLENGDRLTRAEFERRYEAMPDTNKAELIEGVVYVPSPTRATHARDHGAMIAWLVTYCAATPGLDFGDNATVRLDADNEVQPDVLLRREKETGGSSQISSDDYVEGPPELAVEIAASSASYDLYDKKNVYRRTGVQEYIVWRVHENTIDWFALREGVYESLPEKDGRIESITFPGLALNVAAMLDGDLAAVLETQRDALQSDAHKDFVQRLQERPD